MYFAALGRLNRILFRFVEVPPQACLLRPRVAEITRLEVHHRRPNPPAQNTNRVFQGPKYRPTGVDQPKTGVNDGQCLSVIIVRPFPSSTRYSKHRAGWSRQYPIDTFCRFVEQSYIGTINSGIDNHRRVTGIPIRCRPCASATAQIENQALFYQSIHFTTAFPSLASLPAIPTCRVRPCR